MKISCKSSTCKVIGSPNNHVVYFCSGEESVIKDEEANGNICNCDWDASNIEGKSISHPTLVAHQTKSNRQILWQCPRNIIEIFCSLIGYGGWGVRGSSECNNRIDLSCIYLYLPALIVGTANQLTICAFVWSIRIITMTSWMKVVHL
jgi:hypothetical protein